MSVITRILLITLLHTYLSTSFPGTLDPQFNFTLDPVFVSISSLLYHPTFKQLLLTTNDGRFLRVDPESGVVLDSINFHSDNVSWPENESVSELFNLEAITYVDESSNIIYFAVTKSNLNSKFNNSIWEYDVESHKILRIFDIENFVSYTLPLRGVKGLTFVPGHNTTQGMFYVGIQETGYIYRLLINVDPQSTSKIISLGFFSISKQIGITDLLYDRVNDVLYINYDKYDANTVAATYNGSCVLSQWTLPGYSIEAIAVNGKMPNTDIWISSDNGVLKYTWPVSFNTFCSPPSPAPPQKTSLELYSLFILPILIVPVCVAVIVNYWNKRKNRREIVSLESMSALEFVDYNSDEF